MYYQSNQLIGRYLGKQKQQYEENLTLLNTQNGVIQSYIIKSRSIHSFTFHIHTLIALYPEPQHLES
jgi:hypothetical protein